MCKLISAKHLCKDYGNNRGIFDVNFSISEGECFGYVGTNGSGKTTTIRSMMGFIRPDKGTVTIDGLDSWKDSVHINKQVSYIPGEIAFPPSYTGKTFLKVQAGYMGIRDFSYMNELISVLQLDVSGPLKSMSKGMKQKTAIVAALMGDKPILIFDEPTTGLDPLMREVFLDLILKEKKKGKTIFMSTHIFEEAERLCDRVAMLHDGHLVDIVDIAKLNQDTNRTFEVVYTNGDIEKFNIDRTQLNDFFQQLNTHSSKKAAKIYEHKRNLKTVFKENFERG